MKRLEFRPKKFDDKEYSVINKKGEFLGDIAFEKGRWKLIICDLGRDEIWFTSGCLNEIAEFLIKKEATNV